VKSERLVRPRPLTLFATPTASSRAPEDTTTAALEDLAETVSSMANAVAAATGTTTTVTREREPYHHFRNNAVLTGRFAAHLAAEGIVLTEPAPGVFLGSSDIGNVSTVAPAIHPFVAIVDPGDVGPHPGVRRRGRERARPHDDAGRGAGRHRSRRVRGPGPVVRGVGRVRGGMSVRRLLRVRRRSSRGTRRPPGPSGRCRLLARAFRGPLRTLLVRAERPTSVLG